VYVVNTEQHKAVYGTSNRATAMTFGDLGGC